MTPAMYSGIKDAVKHVDADPDLAGLLITGTGDVFAPGGDMGGGGDDNWLTFGPALGMDALPFDTLRQSAKRPHGDRVQPGQLHWVLRPRRDAIQPRCA